MKIRSRTPWKAWFHEINLIIKLLIISDVLVVGAAAMLAPLFAIFVEDYIVGGDVLVVSISMAVYLISKSLIQIPIADVIDRIRGERDDYLLMVVFSLVMSLIPLLYLIVRTPLQLYVVQILMGVASAITYPSYMAIFSRHMDKYHEGTEWGLYYTLTDLGSAGLAVIGGYLTHQYGFPALILVVTLVSVIGSLLLIPIKYSLHFRKARVQE